MEIADYLNATQITQRTPEWYATRLSKITASDVATILDFNEHKTPGELLNEKKTGHISEANKATEWGNRFEPVARNLCAQEYELEIYELGFKCSEKHPYLGASPDGIAQVSHKLAQHFPHAKQGEITLIEFKCPIWRSITRQIPLSYWIQMQIQMEVWDVDHCLYAEYKFAEDPKNKLCDSWSIMVQRDTQWVTKILPYIQKFYQKMNTNETPSISWTDYHHTQEITNYLLEDPLLDWLNLHGNTWNPIVEKDSPPNLYNFPKYVLQKYCEFRAHVVSYLKDNYRDNLIDIAEDPLLPKEPKESKEPKEPKEPQEPQEPKEPKEPQEPQVDCPLLVKYQNRSTRNIQRTKEAIAAEIPIIVNALVHNPEKKTYGRIDLLIRADWAKTIFQKPVFAVGDSKYFMFQIKYSTLNLTANGTTLLNNMKQRIYKGQSALLNEALGSLLDKVPARSYIIGRKSTFKQKGETYQTDSFLNSIGVVDYLDKDKNYIETYNAALQWIETLHREGLTWDPLNPVKEELYPNMKNDRDYPWHKTKTHLAENLGELTQVYNVGVRARKVLHSKGIYHWRDLGIEDLIEAKVPQAPLVAKFIENQKIDQIYNLEKMADCSDIAHTPSIEFYVDFETISDLNDDFSKFPKANGVSLIYMVGCFVKNNLTGKHQHFNYLVDSLTYDCEREMIRDWVKDMVQLLGVTNQEKSRISNKYKKRRINPNTQLTLFHWGQAENYQLNMALEKYGSDMLVNYDLNLVDLHARIKEAQVQIPKCFSYGLKEVAKALYNLKVIQTEWPDDLDGNQAMVAAWKAQEIATLKGTTLDKVPFMEQIINYNYVDCKVMEEIVLHLRRNLRKGSKTPAS